MAFYGDSAQSESQVAFMQFLVKYGKTYATKGDITSRFSTFSENFERVKEHNKGGRFRMGINQFSDMTLEEFTAIYGQNKMIIRDKKQETTRPSLESTLNEVQLPENVDWHHSGKTTVPSDQGGCGSCWAFTTAATLESAFAIRFNSTPERLSVQYLVDCDGTNFACGGGWMLDAYSFTQKKGIVKEDEYEKMYSGRKEQCHDPTDIKDRMHNDDQEEEDSISVQRMKILVATQPMGVAMHSNPSCLMNYHSGVVREADCKCSHEKTATVNHAVTIVGYGKNTQNNSDECPEFWKVRNSWGPNWGEEGYFKLCIPADSSNLPTGTCQVLSYVQYPIFD